MHTYHIYLLDFDFIDINNTACTQSPVSLQCASVLRKTRWSRDCCKWNSRWFVFDNPCKRVGGSTNLHGGADIQFGNGRAREGEKGKQSRHHQLSLLPCSYICMVCGCGHDRAMYSSVADAEWLAETSSRNILRVTSETPSGSMVDGPIESGLGPQASHAVFHNKHGPSSGCWVGKVDRLRRSLRKRRFTAFECRSVPEDYCSRYVGKVVIGRLTASESTNLPCLPGVTEYRSVACRSAIVRNESMFDKHLTRSSGSPQI
jgi:hypothetical protein